MKGHFFCIIFSAISFFFCLHSEQVPRTVYTFYDTTLDDGLWFSKVHQFSSMPLEHLGLQVVYQEVHQELPKLSEDDGVRGLMIWMLNDMSLPEREQLLDYFLEALHLGKKVVVFDGQYWMDFPVGSAGDKKQKELFTFLGVQYQQEWVQSTYFSNAVVDDREMMDFEMGLSGIKKSYPILQKVSSEAHSHLALYYKEGIDAQPSHLVVTTPYGGYIAEGYAAYIHFFNEREYRKWFVNPFLFFRKAFATDDLPKVDIAMKLGRRVYYSHIDGDGWNNISQVVSRDNQYPISAEVIEERVLRKYPELPCTVGLIGADVDLEWVGSRTAQRVAGQIFSLDHIEPASHTFSHPFDWNFFKGYTQEKEEPFLPLFSFGNWKEKKSFFEYISSFFSTEKKKKRYQYPKKNLNDDYTIPRAYANFPFSLEQEIQGSMQMANVFAPKGKQAFLLQWSGDCRPFAKALQLCYESGFENLNGGDTRLDAKFSSYSWVRPLYRLEGNWLQPYASMSNENTYTDLWTDRFFAFNQLQVTWMHTGFPILLRPINLYYHMYSGEKEASLQALLQNISYVQKQAIHPICTSDHAKAVQSFYFAKIYNEKGAYKLVQPKSPVKTAFSHLFGVHTLRFDFATDKGVNFSKSSGVIGQKHLHGSLYVFLDTAEPESAVFLQQEDVLLHEPASEQMYILESSWDIFSFSIGSNKISFSAKGFGPCMIVLAVPEEGEYLVEIAGSDQKQKISSRNGKLVIEPSLRFGKSYTLTVEKVDIAF